MTAKHPVLLELERLRAECIKSADLETDQSARAAFLRRAQALEDDIRIAKSRPYHPRSTTNRLTRRYGKQDGMLKNQ